MKPLNNDVELFTHVGWTKEQKHALEMAVYRPEDAIPYIRCVMKSAEAEVALMVCLKEDEQITLCCRRGQPEADWQEDDAQLKSDLKEGFMPLGFALIGKEEATGYQETHVSLFPWVITGCIVNGRDHRELLNELTNLIDRTLTEHYGWKRAECGPWVN